jgi:hypothetical protein
MLRVLFTMLATLVGGAFVGADGSRLDLASQACRKVVGREARDLAAVESFGDSNKF